MQSLVFQGISNEHGKRHETYVENNDKQEIDVGDVVELKPDIIGNKSQRRILGRPDLVSRVAIIKETLFISFGFGNRDIEVNSTIGARFIVVLGGRVAIVGGTGDSGLALLIGQMRASVEAIQDGDPFSHATRAAHACCCPSLAFCGLGDMAAHLPIVVGGLVVPCAGMY